MAPIPPREAGEPSAPAIEVHEPGSKHPSLADGPGGFSREWFMGKWGVAWSTLPMWKVSLVGDQSVYRIVAEHGLRERRVCRDHTGQPGLIKLTIPPDVTITYTPLEQDGQYKRFESCVSSLKESQSDDASPSSSTFIA